jgi:hypothetical protein
MPAVRETLDRLWTKNSTLLIALLLIVPAFFVAGGQDLRHWQVTILWCGVFMMVGGTVGFLFGIPTGRPVHSKAAGDDDRALASNTNLESISDWLTKILIGLALVNFKDLDEQLGRLTSYVAKGLSGSVDEPFVMALVFYFGSAGLIIGFLVARVYVRLMSTESGARAVAGFTGDIESALARKVEQVLNGPVLANYNGYLCLSIEQPGAHVNAGENTVLVRSRTGELRFQAWLQPEAPSDARLANAAVSVRNGEDREEVEFDIRVDADEFRLIPTSASVSVHRNQPSQKIEFNCVYDLKTNAATAHSEYSSNYSASGATDSMEDDTPPTAAEHPLWLMLFQQNRLLQTITLDFKLQRESRADARP